MPKGLKTGNWKKAGSSHLGSVGFYAPELPKDPKKRLMALIKKERDFIREYPNYIQMCNEARKRLKERQRELLELRQKEK